jgi:hypothetical protein
MTREEFDTIMDGDSSTLGSYEKCRVLLGLNIIAKYLPNSGIGDAQHDIIYAADVDELLEAGLTEFDAIELCNMNWMIDEEGECLAKFT